MQEGNPAQRQDETGMKSAPAGEFTGFRALTRNPACISRKSDLFSE
jgi:hypothetical protein